MQKRKEKEACIVKRKHSPWTMVDTIRASTVILHGNKGATVYGCRKILLYSPTRISLQVCKDVLTVCGNGLYCASFCAGTVCVEGEIMQVTFENAYKRNGSGMRQTEENE